MKSMRILFGTILFGFFWFWSVLGPCAAWSDTQPKIQTFLRPKIYDSVLKDRDVDTRAALDDYTPIPPPPKGVTLKKYSVSSVMLVAASPQKTFQVMTDYQLYSKLIPYVDVSKYDPKTEILELKGGIFGWILHSWIHFKVVSPTWLHFNIVAGHFQGMNGDVYFESRGEKGTLIYLGSSQVLSQWPPPFVLETGAEIVFGFTARRMRSYIESLKPPAEGQENGALPEPRSHL